MLDNFIYGVGLVVVIFSSIVTPFALMIVVAGAVWKYKRASVPLWLAFIRVVAVSNKQRIKWLRQEADKLELLDKPCGASEASAKVTNVK